MTTEATNKLRREMIEKTLALSIEYRGVDTALEVTRPTDRSRRFDVVQCDHLPPHLHNAHQ